MISADKTNYEQLSHLEKNTILKEQFTSRHCNRHNYIGNLKNTFLLLFGHFKCQGCASCSSYEQRHKPNSVGDTAVSTVHRMDVQQPVPTETVAHCSMPTSQFLRTTKAGNGIILASFERQNYDDACKHTAIFESLILHCI